MARLDLTGPCARCGVRTWAEFCRDCHAVDPVMTAGGRSARTMSEIRGRAERQHRDLLYTLAVVARAANRRQRRRTAA